MLSFFLARRFFFAAAPKGSRRASTPAVRIATAGIAVGLAVMIVSVCVVRGFQREIRSILTGFTSHIEVMDENAFFSPETYPVAVDSALLREVSRQPHVAHVQRFAQKMGIFKTTDDFAGIMLKGLGSDADLTFLRDHVVQGRLPQLSDTATHQGIVVSSTLANKLGLKLGDKVYGYFFSQTIKQRRFRIEAIYDTHMRQFDENYVFTAFPTVCRLNGWNSDQCSGLEVRLDDLSHLTEADSTLCRLMRGRLDRYGKPYTVVSMRRHPRSAPILSWLDLLDFNVMVILIIMVCVAGFTMVSGLLILILERTSTIGLLKALGAGNARIRHTFLWFAAFIVGRGLLIGNVVGLLIVAVQASTQLVKLDPSTYYMDAVPVSMEWGWIVVLNVATLGITLLALLLPSHLVSRVQPASAIRFD